MLGRGKDEQGFTKLQTKSEKKSIFFERYYYRLV
jgi:hypothetical protein